MSRELPFCMYQHANVEVLMAYLIRQQKFENGDARFDGFTDPLEAINASDIDSPGSLRIYSRNR